MKNTQIPVTLTPHAFWDNTGGAMSEQEMWAAVSTSTEPPSPAAADCMSPWVIPRKRMASVIFAPSHMRLLCLRNDINNSFWKWFKDAWKEKSIHHGMQGWSIWLWIMHYPNSVFLLLLLISLSGAEIAALKFLTGVASADFPMQQLLPFFLFLLHVCGHVIRAPCYIVHLSTYNGSLCPNFLLWFFCFVSYNSSYIFLFCL